MAQNQPPCPQLDVSHVEQQLDKIIEQIDHLSGAFPMIDGKVDVDGHRRYHESKIKAAEAEAKFWTEVRQESIKKGIWFTMVVVVGLIVVGIQIKLMGWLGIEK